MGVEADDPDKTDDSHLLLADVAAALGISDDDLSKQTDPRNRMADVAVADSDHPSRPTHRSAESSAHPPNSASHKSNESTTVPRSSPRTHRAVASSTTMVGRYGEGDDGTTAPTTPHRRVHSMPASAAAHAVEAVRMGVSAQSLPPVHVEAYVQAAPIAEAVPVPAEDRPDQSSAGVLFYHATPLEKNQISQLRALGYSEGLIEGLNQLKECMPLRYWLVDNSGSMLTNDGRELRGRVGQAQPYSVECTRWAELQGTVAWHASLAGVLGTHTVFRLLNPPEHLPHMHEFAVADPTNTRTSTADTVANAKDVMAKIVPKGFTPLTLHLQRIRDSVQSIRETLVSRGQQAVVIIATDGTPTDEIGDSTDKAREEFRHILKAMQSLPIWIVIRLCTDDPEVVSYYNSLDSQLELSIEVIDDYFHEAKQVNKSNAWLNYAMPLHRCREMGFHPRVFDLLDERVLNKDELLEFLSLLFGEAALVKAPDIHQDWKKFTHFLQALLDIEKEHYNPRTGKMCQWIDMKSSINATAAHF